MALEITLNPKKAIRRKDLAAMADYIKKASKDKKCDLMTLTITDDAKGSPNSMMFPFRIIDEK